MAKQYPIYPEGGNGFGVVRGEAGGTSLADVDLPAAEIGGGWFHGIWFSRSKIYTSSTLATIPVGNLPRFG